LIWTAPFVLLLLAIAILPLASRTAYWWEKNHYKLIVSLLLSAVTLLYYGLRGTGFAHGDHLSAPGLDSAVFVLLTSLMEYLPFIVLLFSLYVISGGIRITGDLPAHPITNTLFLAGGAALASIVGTTGASMFLIRPLLQVNSERKIKTHTVIFFIFVVSNAGGALTPVGDPPLFLGYLMGVPFLWTVINLWRGWLFIVCSLLAIYLLFDVIAYKKESPEDIYFDETRIEPFRLSGRLNMLWLAGVVFCTATVTPGHPFLGTSWTPFLFLREILLLAFVGLSLALTGSEIREKNDFNYTAIGEVACLFIGIFITMQVPIEILHQVGPKLGFSSAHAFFWFTGLLSSFLDNAPTYVVFFQTAGTLSDISGASLVGVQTSTGTISSLLLVAISYGSVFMGANTYIGNGPNFMVKSIAESAGVKMPSFFGYIFRYSLPILLPLFVVFTLIFF
jgi:Na+/H+ antiporter NhaD/arsenite permease-like protein